MCSCNRGRGSGSGPGPGPGPSVVVKNNAYVAARRPTRLSAPAAAAAAAPAPPAPPPRPTVDTSVWGAPLWKVLHTASVFTKTATHIPLWRHLIKALKSGLPCPDCSAHYNAWVSSNGVNFSIIGDGVRAPAIAWVLALHNNVNSRQDPPVAPWTVKQVVAAYAGAPAEKADRIAAAVTALQRLQGVIGPSAFDAAMALLKSIN